MKIQHVTFQEEEGSKLKNLTSKKYFRQVLIGVFTCTFIISSLILVVPFWPKVAYALNKPDPGVIHYQVTLPASYALPGAPGLNVATSDVKPIPKENRLVIPQIGVDSEILEAPTLDVLLSQEGVWREPESSNPTEEGNMVIAGHRFQYLPPNTNTFYNLDQMKDGDQIIIFWNSQTFIYQVYQTLTVSPDDVSIRNLDPGETHQLTIYTCTPLYTSTDRLVVKAKLIS